MSTTVDGGSLAGAAEDQDGPLAVREIPFLLVLEPHDLGDELLSEIVRESKPFFQILDAVIDQLERFGALAIGVGRNHGTQPVTQIDVTCPRASVPRTKARPERSSAPQAGCPVSGPPP